MDCKGRGPQRRAGRPGAEGEQVRGEARGSAAATPGASRSNGSSSSSFSWAPQQARRVRQPERVGADGRGGWAKHLPDAAHRADPAHGGSADNSAHCSPESRRGGRWQSRCRNRTPSARQRQISWGWTKKSRQTAETGTAAPHLFPRQRCNLVKLGEQLLRQALLLRGGRQPHLDLDFVHVPRQRRHLGNCALRQINLTELFAPQLLPARRRRRPRKALLGTDPRRH